jgi:hypothetical protein
MKFVLVNGRTPVRQNSCVLCAQPIREGGYLRDIWTRLCCRGAMCHALQSGNPVMLLEKQAKVS